MNWNCSNNKSDICTAFTDVISDTIQFVFKDKSTYMPTYWRHEADIGIWKATYIENHNIGPDEIAQLTASLSDGECFGIVRKYVNDIKNNINNPTFQAILKHNTWANDLILRYVILCWDKKAFVPEIIQQFPIQHEKLIRYFYHDYIPDCEYERDACIRYIAEATDVDINTIGIDN